MTPDQITVFVVLLFVMVMFVWGKFRYDIVALSSLIIAVIVGVVPAKEAFLGFSNSAVMTVAAVLIISRGLSVSGAIDRISHLVVPQVKSLVVQISTLSGFAALLSAIMNNVGALALLMPATISAAKKAGRSPSLLLMPLSFGSILGGLVTLIGTPPNIIIASYRAEALGEPFSMFDFTPVGSVTALAGILFLALFGWRFLPKERKAKSAPDELFDVEEYVAEAVINNDSPMIGKKLGELIKLSEKHDVLIAGLIRNHVRNLRPGKTKILQENDILILEADPTELDKFSHELGLEIKGDIEKDPALFSSEDVKLVEAVLSSDSRLVGRVVGDLRLRSRYGINLMGISRQGNPIRKSLHKVKLSAGDVLLFQAEVNELPDVQKRLGLLPLQERGFQVGKRDHALIATLFLGGAVMLAAFGILDLTISLLIAALGMVLFNIVPLRDMYDSIDWPVIVLVGAMIPIGGALETTGATELVAHTILDYSSSLTPILILALLLIVTMTLSDVMNNAATAVVMAPVGISMANSLGANPDAFLMAVAVGASCAFLTPIGHKNNALIMGPGGYQFGDYWRMGLPLEVVVIVVSVPMIAYVWPLGI